MGDAKGGVLMSINSRNIAWPYWGPLDPYALQRENEELRQLVRYARLAQRRAKRMKTGRLGTKDSRRDAAAESRMLTAMLDRAVGLLPSE